MHVLVAAIALLATASPGRASWERVEGDGVATTEPRQVAAFTRISSRSELDLVVKIGPPLSVAVTADRDLLQYVRTEVEGDTLVVDTLRPVRPRARAVVAVTLPSLLGLEVDGSGGAEVVGDSTAKELSLSTHGSGDVSYCGAAAALAVESQGSGGATVNGAAGDLRVRLSGSGDFRYEGKAGRVRIRTVGSGDARLFGSAESLQAESLGSGDVDARELPARDATVRTAGSGDVQLRLAGGKLDAATTGSGDVDWWGEGSLAESRSSGSGRVAHHR